MLRLNFRRSALVFALLLTAAAPVLADGPFRYFALTPCRVIDTRQTPGPFTGNGSPALPGSTNTTPSSPTRSFTIQGNCGVPVGAKAAALNVTVWQPTHKGHLRIFPSGGAVPGISTLNFAGGEQALANGAIVPLSSNAQDLSVYAYQITAGANVGLIVDVTGYFATVP